jgi:beta-glucosidase
MEIFAMFLRRSLSTSSLIILVACSSANKTAPPAAYLDTSLSFEQRVNDLVSRMTTLEKIAQMYNDAPAIERLGVPAYDYWNEALHGVARAGKATVFPQAIGMAAMWDQDLMLTVATAISDEGRAKHHFFVDNDVHYRYTGLTFWSPNINIFRDPRWGRGQETYGEDPYLTGELAVQFIHGLQGDDPKYLKTAATAKHFAVHNGPEISRHSDNYMVSNKDLYETYMPAFEKAIVDADVEAVMCAYNRVNGQPACGSDLLLKDILRGQFKFNGHVMSDCGAIADFYDPKAHNVVQAPAVAAAWAVTAGTDLNCGTGRLSTFANLNFALQKDLISEDLIDQAVQRLFMTRFKLGMFDPEQDVSYANIPPSVVGSTEHLALAQKATESSLVLLKNDGLLPLKKGIKVAVMGPNADNEDVLLGNYNGIPIAPVTPLQGIANYLGAEQVSYAPGSAIIADVYGHYSKVGAEYFFHQNANNALVGGLQAKYYQVSHPKITDFTDLRPSGQMVGEPLLSRIDDNIDFYWERSPIDDKVMSDFGVVWQGILVPPSSGNYRFDGAVDITINGEAVQGTVNLVAGQHYAFQASRIFLKNPWSNTIPTLTLRWLNESQNLLDDALAQAKKADVVVVVVGISPRIEGEEMPVKLDGFNYGDREDIDLPDEQQNLIKALHKLGKPMVLVNFSGSAVALNWENDNLNAIVQAFYPGEATGTALARLLWGEYSPSGRLPITFYKNLAGFAAFDDYAMENRTYKYFAGEVLYPFGYGLSYGDFRYSNLQAPAALSAGQDLNISVDVSNLSDMDSAEITQLYVSMPDAPVRVPQLELAGFQRHELAKGGQQTLHFTLTPKQLTYVDNNGIHQPYIGKLLLSVGSGQPKYVKAQHKQQAIITLN